MISKKQMNKLERDNRHLKADNKKLEDLHLLAAQSAFSNKPVPGEVLKYWTELAKARLSEVSNK